MQQVDHDTALMQRALALAEHGRCGASPNPMVGACVLDRHNQLVGQGHHAAYGTEHAETVALTAAGAAAEYGTLYVSLEPCAHHGKTPPCVDAIVAAKVRRVVIAMRDPHAQAAGGVEKLRAAGIEVTVGVCQEDARRLNRRWLRWAEQARPWVTLKSALSCDGKIATRTGESQWITSEESRHASLMLREEHDAILVGAGTVRADDPRLTRRLGTNPVPRWHRIVLDSHLRTPLTARICCETPPSTLLAHTPDAPADRQRQLLDAGVQLLPCAADERGRINLADLLTRLAQVPIASLLVEGGAQVNGSFVDDRLVDEIRFFLAPVLIGGPAPNAVAGEGVSRLAAALRFDIEALSHHGGDMQIVGICREISDVQGSD